MKNPLASAGDIRDVSSVPGLRRYSSGGNDSPLQYSCLENPTDGRGAGSLAGYSPWGRKESDMNEGT